jgi:hypothetical protein
VPASSDRTRDFDRALADDFVDAPIFAAGLGGKRGAVVE